MTSVLLIYPYFKPKKDRSTFRFPPLGLGYVASSLRRYGCDVDLLDCTFLDRENALRIAVQAKADVVGIYSMTTMQDEGLIFARLLRENCDLLIAGGPLPSCDPVSFLNDFDVAVLGEGEQTVCEVLEAYEKGSGFDDIRGIAYRKNGQIIFTEDRELEQDLDCIPFPARNLFPNQSYIDYGKKRFGYAATTIITTRGCPFNCEFCSNAVFGSSYRERSPGNVLDEIEEALSFGYEKIHFADDVFTLNKKRMLRICDEIAARGMNFKWECLGRVDSMDCRTAMAMKKAGCERIFFGIESGDESILRLMNKRITADVARRAVETAGSSGLKTGAFFIICYPGENDGTVLRTIRFATSLPLDYLSFTTPRPLPGTALYKRVQENVERKDDADPCNGICSDFGFSRAKMRFAVLKGQTQFRIRKVFGVHSPHLLRLFEAVTDVVFRLMK